MNHLWTVVKGSLTQVSATVEKYSKSFNCPAFYYFCIVLCVLSVHNYVSGIPWVLEILGNA